MTHALKTITGFYDSVDKGEKNFEVRKNDRPFMVGDDLLLQQWNGEEYSGKELKRRIIYKLDGGQFGIEKGFVVLGIKEIENY